MVKLLLTAGNKTKSTRVSIVFHKCRIGRDQALLSDQGDYSTGQGGLEHCSLPDDHILSMLHTYGIINCHALLFSWSQSIVCLKQQSENRVHNGICRASLHIVPYFAITIYNFCADEGFRKGKSIHGDRNI